VLECLNFHLYDERERIGNKCYFTHKLCQCFVPLNTFFSSSDARYNTRDRFYDKKQVSTLQSSLNLASLNQPPPFAPSSQIF
jgi:hypothetical protein